MRKDEQGQEVRKLRTNANITLNELSLKVNIDESYLSRLELGLRRMPQPLYFRLRAEICAIAEERLRAVSH